MFFRSVRCFTGEIHQLLCFAPRPRAKKNFTQGGSNKFFKIYYGIRKYKAPWAQNGGAGEIDPFTAERAWATGKTHPNVRSSPLPSFRNLHPKFPTHPFEVKNMYGNQMAKNMVGNMAKNMAGNGFLVRRRDVDDKGQPLKKPQKPRQERQNPRFELSSKVRKRCKKQGKIDVEAYVNERLFHDAQGGYSQRPNASPEFHGNIT